MQSQHPPYLVGKVSVFFRLAGQQQHHAAATLLMLVFSRVGKVSFVLQIDMAASSGAAHGWSEQELGDALEEDSRLALAELDPNASPSAQRPIVSADPQVELLQLLRVETCAFAERIKTAHA